MPKGSASAWLSDLSQATMAPLARWELAGLSGEALVLEGAGALSAGQIASSAAVALENKRLEAEGKSGASYYELGSEKGASLSQGGRAEPEAVAVVRALEGRLRGPVPPGMSLGQLLNLESGLKKIERAAPNEVTMEELRAVARSPAAMAQARTAGIPKTRLEKAEREERQRRVEAIESSRDSAKARAAKRMASASGGEEASEEAGVKAPGDGMKKSIEQWREASEKAKESVEQQAQEQAKAQEQAATSEAEAAAAGAVASAAAEAAAPKAKKEPKM